MNSETTGGLRLEIAHVLFIDIVGYSKLLLNEQSEALRELNEIVRNTEQFRVSETAGKLLRLPTGDGMALIFRSSPEGPAEGALEIAGAAKDHPRLRLRMGIHSGPVNEIADVNERANIAGAGINIAQRVMDCGDAGHILLSKHIAEDLDDHERWRSRLHDLGEVTVKHGVTVHIVNLYTAELGNPQPPARWARERAIVERRKRTRKIRNAVVAASCLGLIGVAAIFFLSHRPRAQPEEAAVDAKSIAVLPFENFSDDKENAFFADGIQDDILTSLAKIRELRVISRTSVENYRDAKAGRNLREIGKALGVANVLEGSVRRAGDRVAVTVQLIEAAQDRHLWANRYERTIADSLGLQGELAGEIASALHAVLSPEEKARVETRPTENADAYVFYLRASQIAHNPDTLLEDYKTAMELYRQAISLDPKFALAHARLASTCAEIFHFYEPTENWKTKARAEAELALQLQPSLAEAHFALGQYIYWIEGDYERALPELKLALALSPNNGDASVLIASIKRRQGHWQEALDAFEQAEKIDPQNPNVTRNVVFTLTAMRRWPEAARACERWRIMAPASLVGRIEGGYVDFWWKGDTALLRSRLSEISTDPDGSITSARWDLAMIERDYATASRLLLASSLNELAYTNAAATPKSLFQGCIALASGEMAGARKSFELARPLLESAVQEAPTSADRHANLGWLYAFMGRKEDAIREGRRAVELKPESKDAVDGAIMNCYLALIYARVGENDLALALIQRLLETPGAVDSANYSITVNDLKSRWEWDPVRSDPRFQKLIGDRR